MAAVSPLGGQGRTVGAGLVARRGLELASFIIDGAACVTATTTLHLTEFDKNDARQLAQNQIYLFR